MVNLDLLSVKLAELADRVQRVRHHAPSSADGLRANRDTLDLVAFNLMLAVQTCADIAAHLIADEGWPAARNIAEGFARLQEHDVIAPEVAASLAKAVGLRNVVAHGYAGVDVDMVHAAASKGLADLDAFARSVATYAQRQITRPES
jgi:uncharacterized protein YutE (UPF0331/DUF86 family)